MDKVHFRTYGDSPNQAFETLCNQLFERYLRRTYPGQVVKIRALNGAGGDGGIEAYGQLRNGTLMAIQSKWFPDNIGDSQIGQIRHSVTTALALRPNIAEYIICVPRNLNSTTFRRGPRGAGPRPAVDTEERRVDDLTDELHRLYPHLTITWWFEQDIDLQLQQEDNDGVLKFWFETELVSFTHLKNQFDLQRHSWLRNRYIPDLHGQGVIQKGVQQLLFNEPYRRRLASSLDGSLVPLRMAFRLIPQFLGTLSADSPLRPGLEEVRGWIAPWMVLARDTAGAILSGQHQLPAPLPSQPPIDTALLHSLASINPSGVQKSYYQELVDSLYELSNLDLQTIFSDLQQECLQIGQLFLGSSGTGKTHGLANTVEQQLAEHVPAIIIRAKVTPCGNWTEILTQALDAPGWTTNQALSALESLAVRQDNRAAALLPASPDSDKEPTKVVVCIDGLEEDTLHWADWYDRMGETIPLTTRFPRIKFVFSARPYYHDPSKMPATAFFRAIFLPAEGDVPVRQVMAQYFAPEHFNITVDPASIRGIDTLFALRLFCDEYKGQTLSTGDHIITAEKLLLNKKVERMNQEFRDSLQGAVSSSRKPVLDALHALTDAFYTSTDIELSEVCRIIAAATGTYLNGGQIDILVEYLVNNGILIRTEFPGGDGLLAITRTVLSLSQQSILELIISDRLVREIQNGSIDRLPEKYVAPQLAATATQEDFELAKTQRFVDEKIVTNTIQTLLSDHGKLIGEDDFLASGLDRQQIQTYQFKALADAPKEIDPKYGEWVRREFTGDPGFRYYIFRDIINPAASSSVHFFGAEFLHDILSAPSTAFARENLWLGWDRLSIRNFERASGETYSDYALQQVIDPDDAEFLVLSPYALHNEYPLIFGWALSTLDQRLRHKLRVALTAWALVQSAEFVTLLNKLFPAGDPQVQEDLASITLGLAGKLKDRSGVQSIAEWAIDHVFGDLERNRNVIVREGFRAIVERAYQLGLISPEQVQQARPTPTAEDTLLQLDEAALRDGGEEIYPIVHDLAWYVIKRAFNDFLDYPSQHEPRENPAPGGQFLRRYAQAGIADKLGPHRWATAAAIQYIKSLGFDRTDGNGSTQATHGSKSKVFTLEEKYTWLAVHYLLGYLADRLPLKSEERFVESYFEIVDVPNPADFLPVAEDEGPLVKLKKQWVIQEELIPAIAEGPEFEVAIRDAVHQEPALDFTNWLVFDSSDFTDSTPTQKMVALYNYTVLHDARRYVVGRIDARACLIKKGQLPVLTDLVLNHPRRSSFTLYIDNLHASPATDVYSNPSDITWMNWIGETDAVETYYPPGGGEEQLLYCLSSVTNNTIRGEQEVKIPSKISRQLTGIVELDNEVFTDRNGLLGGILHEIREEDHQSQDLLMVREDQWLRAVDEAGYETVWFVELLHRKYELNEQIKSDEHPQKCRKYLVYYDAGVIRAVKFWDAHFSNSPD